MKAGRMRSRIEAFRPVQRKDLYGAKVNDFESQGWWHAERVALSGHRVLEASEQFADYTVRYNIRLQHFIQPNWQITGDDGLRYIVTAVEPVRWLGMQTIICERLNP